MRRLQDQVDFAFLGNSDNGFKSLQSDQSPADVGVAILARSQFCQRIIGVNQLKIF